MDKQKEVNPWAKLADEAWAKLDVPLAFFLTMEIANRHPHDIELASVLRSAIRAIKDARQCLVHIMHDDG